MHVKRRARARLRRCVRPTACASLHTMRKRTRVLARACSYMGPTPRLAHFLPTSGTGLHHRG
eukprot:141732-Chlamydomonas_euryale.AAC.1